MAKKKKKKMTPAQAAAARRDDKPRAKRPEPNADALKNSGPRERDTRLIIVIAAVCIVAAIIVSVVIGIPGITS